MKENSNEKSDTIAAIGIGAMIVFIALILVAAVAAAVIIQTAEKLQQNAQTTGSDATDMLSSKVIIMSIHVSAANELYITFELAPGSSDIPPANVEWSIVCPGAANTGGADYGTFAQASFVGNLNVVAAQAVGQNLLVAHTTYDLHIVPTPGAVGGLDFCIPVANEDHTLLIQSFSGGFTFETLNYGSDVSVGAVVV